VPEEPTANAATETGATRPKSRLTQAALLILLLAVSAGLLSYWRQFIRERPLEGTRNPSAQSLQPAAATNPAPEKATSPPAASKPPKSIDDLKPGPIVLEKTKGSSLVYAVGVLKNDSEHQRFGVNIELELSDSRGNRVGMAKDYRAVLEPGQQWRFRALVLDSKAVSARVVRIREEE